MLILLDKHHLFMQKILITGANGLLGQKLVYKLKNDPEVQLIATARGENRLLDQEGYEYAQLDISDMNQVKEVLGDYKPDVVIHTAAMTNVDACELQQEECKQMNVRAVQYIAFALEQAMDKTPGYHPHLVHLSTDFIFDGTKGPLTEEEEPNPLSYYAKSKLEAEYIVMGCRFSWAIARTVLVYGVVDNASRSNIVLWAKSSLEQKKNINVVNDQFRTPTLAEDLADGCILIAKKKATGIYNISGPDFMHILELVTRVADFWKLDKSLITPSTSEGIQQPAKRPPVTGFIIDKARKDLGYTPHNFEEGLALVDKQLKAAGK
ncbi:MAG: dTDP-4-dehydrorhamnose reductase [Bacteroidetes bacterium]|nr:dTDP-4-dehydrorhamnose reductase [Bacteroidota bacterium]